MTYLANCTLRTRPAARLLIVDSTNRVLLFRFTHAQGALRGQSYWATPGGGVEPGESFEQAAVRELREETGIRIADPGPVVSVRETRFQLPDGTWVLGYEHYFLIRVSEQAVSKDAWTDHEREVISMHKWWTVAELNATSDTVWPEQLANMLART